MTRWIHGHIVSDSLLSAFALQKCSDWSVGILNDGNIIAADYSQNKLRTFSVDGNLLDEVELLLTPEEAFQFDSNTKTINGLSASYFADAYYEKGSGCINHGLTELIVPSQIRRNSC